MKTWKIWYLLTVIVIAITASICVIAFMNYDNGNKNNSTATVQFVEKELKLENISNNNFETIDIDIKY